MNDRFDNLRKKAATLLTQASASRVARSLNAPDRTAAREAIRIALGRAYGRKAASNLAFHLVDWTGDAAFIMALCMFPEQFSGREIRDGVDLLLVHVPNHVAAAAKISGNQCKDIWKEKPAIKVETENRPTKHTVRREARRP
jgi:hypothetical protein